MKNLFILILTLLFSSNLSAQTQCFITGPTEVDCFEQQELFYSLLCDPTSYPVIKWELFPGEREGAGQIVYQDTFNAQIALFQNGTFILTAFYETSTGIDSTSIDIFYFGGSSELTVDSCAGNNYNRSTGCYQVCEESSSRVEISDPNQGNGEWSVSGAREVRDFGNYLEIDWGGPGRGTVNYFSFCGENSVCFDILPEPEPDFSTMPSSTGDTLVVCRNQEIFFENNSVNAFNYSWDFGDGERSEEFETSHSYSEEGLYLVTLNAYSVCECAGEKEMYVRALEAPAPTLDCVNSVCPETRQKYTAATDGCTTYNWNISDNGTIINGGESDDDFIEVIWHEGPDGIIELSVSDCSTQYCSFTNTFRVPIITPDGPIDGDASVCSGQITQYSAPYFLGTVYNWSVSNGGIIRGNTNSNAVTVQWDDVNSTTNAIVSVNYDNCFLECSGEDQFSVQITPTISITAPAQVCQGDDASANATAGFFTPLPVNVEWLVKDANGATVLSGGNNNTTTINFNIPAGEYTWVAINTSDDYCNNEIVQKVSVTPTPPAPLGISGETSICAGLSYGYTINNAGDYETNWVVTDGINQITYSGQSITHVFGSTPPYEVSATHVDVQYPSCSSDAVNIVLSSAADNQLAGMDTVCHESIETYTTELIGGADYIWNITPADMGEILVDNTNTVNIFWTESGAAQITLDLCGVSITKDVIIRANPAYTINGTFSACGNVPVAISTSASGLQHIWRNEEDNFVAGTDTANLLPGFYSVEVLDEYGCSTTEAFEIEALPFPSVSLTSPQKDIYCDVIPDGVPLVANTDGDDYVFTWFKDGTAVGNGPNYLATDFGDYQVEATNQFGCSALSLIATIGSCCPIEECLDTIVGNPDGCSYLPFDFQIMTSDITCNQKQYTPAHPDLLTGTGRWYISSISDGFIASYNSDQATHTYKLPGYYRVAFGGQLDGYNYPLAKCDHQELFIDTVRAVADFKVETACAGELVELTDLTTFIPGETIVSWLWEFDDPTSGANNTSADQDPSHTFNDPGTYNVKLTIVASSGCTSTIEKELLISGGPELAVVYDNINCAETSTAFSLTGAEFNINWEFGDPASGSENTATAAFVYHTYDNAGIFNAAVSAEDIYGCTNIMNLAVDIRANNLSGTIDIDPSATICQGETVTLTAPTGGTSWKWSTEETSSAISVTESDQYSVFIKDENNCTYTTPAEFITVLPSPVVITKARIVYGPDNYGPWVDRLQVCDNLDFEIHAISTQSLNYLWDGGSMNQVLSFSGDGSTFPGPGIHIFTVEGTDPVSGCVSAESSIEVEVYDVPDVPNIQITSGSACSFDDNVLEVVSPESNLTYLWSDGQQGTQITVTNDGLYSVTAINNNGCQNTSSVINILKSEPVDQLPGGCFDACDPLTVCLPSLNNVQSYVIYRNGTEIESGTTWPNDFLADEDGSYTIEVTSTNGCTATSLPLDITLYTGVGILTVQVYVDVDNNGVISAADTLISGIAVRSKATSDTQEGEAETEEDGAFDFVDFPTGGYLNSINLDELHPRWTVIIDSLTANINTCDDSTSVALLIANNCTVYGDTVDISICPDSSFTFQDSTWIGLGQYEHHYTSSGGCDSIITVNALESDSFNLVLKAWMDIDEDGMRSSSDTLLPAIDIIVENLTSGIKDTTEMDSNGCFMKTYPREPHLIYSYRDSLDPVLTPVIDSITVDGSLCGDNEIYLLFRASCKPLIISETRILCDGDSTLVNGNYETEAGTYSEIISDPASLCDTTRQVTITVLPELILDAILTNECDGMGGSGSITLLVTGEGPFVYNWNPRVSTDSIAENLTPGDYDVTVFDRNGCSVAESYTIDSVGLLEFSIMPVFITDVGVPVVLEIMGDINEPNLSVEWIPTDNLSCTDCFAPEASVTETTVYTAIITDELGCTYTVTTTVELQEPCSSQFFLDDEVFVFEGDTTRLIIAGDTSQAGITVFWTPDNDLTCSDCFATKAYPEVTTAYTATITEADGCIYNLNTQVTVLADSTGPTLDLYMPNIFLPDSDSENSVYKLKSRIDDAQLISMRIFNRRGAQLYQERNVRINEMRGWDGRVENQLVLPQVLVFVAEVSYPDGRIEQVTGDITLVR